MDPHINPATGVWDDNYYNTVGKYGGSSSDPNLNLLNSNNNAYIDQLLSQAKGQRDLVLKQLDAQHQLALGNNDDATAKFLESVADQVEAQEGRIPYDYNRYTARENQGYGIQSGQIADTRQLALAKLAEDERAQTAGLNLAQGQGNQTTAEALNQRGLAYGAVPTGLTGGAPTTQALGGFGGIGSYAQNANNTGFANQRTALTNSIGLGRQEANLTAKQAQQNLDFAHQNTLQDLTTNARRDVQDQQNAYTFGTQQANQNFGITQADLNRQRLALQLAAPGQAATLTAYQKGILGS
jgi:hypothetical protein